MTAVDPPPYRRPRGPMAPDRLHRLALRIAFRINRRIRSVALPLGLVAAGVAGAMLEPGLWLAAATLPYLAILALPWDRRRAARVVQGRPGSPFQTRLLRRGRRSAARILLARAGAVGGCIGALFALQLIALVAGTDGFGLLAREDGPSPLRFGFLAGMVGGVAPAAVTMGMLWFRSRQIARKMLQRNARMRRVRRDDERRRAQGREIQRRGTADTGTLQRATGRSRSRRPRRGRSPRHPTGTLLKTADTWAMVLVLLVAGVFAVVAILSVVATDYWWVAVPHAVAAAAWIHQRHKMVQNMRPWVLRYATCRNERLCRAIIRIRVVGCAALPAMFAGLILTIFVGVASQQAAAARTMAILQQATAQGGGPAVGLGGGAGGRIGGTSVFAPMLLASPVLVAVFFVSTLAILRPRWLLAAVQRIRRRWRHIRRPSARRRR